MNRAELTNVIVYGAIVGCLLSISSRLLVGQAHLWMNLFIGLVAMAIDVLVEKLVHGSGTVVCVLLGTLAAYTIVKRQNQ